MLLDVFRRHCRKAFLKYTGSRVAWHGTVELDGAPLPQQGRWAKKKPRDASRCPSETT